MGGAEWKPVCHGWFLGSAFQRRPKGLFSNDYTISSDVSRFIITVSRKVCQPCQFKEWGESKRFVSEKWKLRLNFERLVIKLLVEFLTTLCSERVFVKCIWQTNLDIITKLTSFQSSWQIFKIMLEYQFLILEIMGKVSLRSLDLKTSLLPSSSFPQITN